MNGSQNNAAKKSLITKTNDVNMTFNFSTPSGT